MSKSAVFAAGKTPERFPEKCLLPCFKYTMQRMQSKWDGSSVHVDLWHPVWNGTDASVCTNHALQDNALTFSECHSNHQLQPLSLFFMLLLTRSRLILQLDLRSGWHHIRLQQHKAEQIILAYQWGSNA